MEKNKTGKYMKYAIGEILLVIIGILIALQINNWNEIRKSKLEGIALLELLLVDLENDITHFESLKREYNVWLAEIDNIMNVVLDNKKERIIKHDQYVAGRSSMNFLQVNKITFLEMFNSGKDLKYDNKTIVKDIKTYFQYADTELIKLNSDNEIFFEWLLSTDGIKGVNTWHRLYNGRNLDHIDWTWRTKINSEEYMRFESINLYYKLAIEVNLEIIEKLQNKSESLIKKISKELDQ